MATTTITTTSPVMSRSTSTSSSSSYKSNSSTSSFKSALSASSSARKQQPSWHSSGWYNTENAPTLEDFARRLETTAKRFERWQGKCAQDMVMALLGPTPGLLLVLNPVSIFLLMMVVLAWLIARSGAS